MQTNLIIWLSTWDFYRVTNTRNTDEMISEYFAIEETNAIEIMFHNISDTEQQIGKETIGKYFSYCSIHAPVYNYQNDEKSHKILKIINNICSMLPIKNIVIHPDLFIDRSVFYQYSNLPFSIENLDDNKKSCKWIQDIWKILKGNPDFWFTLDLQHCFTNDPSMQLAKDFHKEFWSKIVEYHISWFHPEYIHYPLFKTKQIQIIKALENVNIPIIIESTFDEKTELKKEIEYILSLF